MMCSVAISTETETTHEISRASRRMRATRRLNAGKGGKGGGSKGKGKSKGKVAPPPPPPIPQRIIINIVLFYIL